MARVNPRLIDGGVLTVLDIVFLVRIKKDKVSTIQQIVIFFSRRDYSGLDTNSP
jgi:hypothetical protein